MESLKLEEEMLEQQLCTYKTQLSVVTETLSKESVGQEYDELLSLQSDLEELITLTSDSLLEVKKQSLLSSFGCSLNEVTSETVTNHDVERNDNVSESVPSSIDDEQVLTAVDNDGNSGDNDPIIQGMKCRAPFDQEMSWRGVSYHNAMILCEEPNEMVRVIFTHPRFDSMKPCSFFLEGNCKFSDDTCRYSHGHIVSIDQLQPFTDPNFSSLHSGSRCVAKHSDGLFHDAVVRHCGDLLTVQFTTSGNKDEIEISIEDIIPLSGSDSNSSSNCSSSDVDSDVVEEKDNDDVCIIDWIPRNPLGQWEQYTSGIGSKLLTKMGYVIGKGLGRDNQGRVEPVPIEILPSGKSLDVCIAIREEKRLKMATGDNGKKKRKKKRKGNIRRLSVNQERSSKDVFAFLNTRLGQVNNVAKNKGARNTSQKSENLNIELFKVQETISNLEKKIKVLKSRNSDRKDKRVEEHIEKNVLSVDNKLQHLKKQERLIMNKMKRKSEETKLSVF